MGVGIQGNKYNKKRIELFVFNVAEYYKGQTYNYDQVHQTLFCINFSNLKTVSVIYPAAILLPTIPGMIEIVKGRSLEADIPREGFVVRNYENNVSFKIVNPDFLLKYSE